jgi:hypothetical protein
MKEIGAMIDLVTSTDQGTLTEEWKTCSREVELHLLLWLIRLCETLLPTWLDNHKTWADKVHHRSHKTTTGDQVDRHLTTIIWVDQVDRHLTTIIWVDQVDRHLTTIIWVDQVDHHLTTIWVGSRTI